MKALAAAVAFAIVLGASPALAAPPGKSECVAAHRDAQLARREARLHAARESLLLCANDACPHPIVAECTPWLEEVERALPTVVFEARANGQDLTDVRVVVDGRAITDRLDGRALDVDPGVHVVRFERAASAPIEQRLVVAEGEKARVVRVEFASSKPPASPAPAPDTRAAVPWPAWALAGTGLVALGGFTLFALTGVNAERDLEGCKPACAPSRIDPVRRDYVTADVFLGVGVVAAVAATIVFLASTPTSRSSSAAY